MLRKYESLVEGQKIGNWEVLQYKKHSSHTRGGYLCRCKCGKEQLIETRSLILGISTQCRTCDNKSRSTHGETIAEHRRTTEYSSWIGMRQRCFNPKSAAYMSYGGRGITVCKRWQGKNGFQNFLADMGRKPSPEHSCDRVDVNGNYEPSNCKWSTKAEQLINRRPFKIGRIESFTDEELQNEIWRRTPEYGIGIAC